MIIGESRCRVYGIENRGSAFSACREAVRDAEGKMTVRNYEVIAGRLLGLVGQRPVPNAEGKKTDRNGRISETAVKQGLIPTSFQL